MGVLESELKTSCAILFVLRLVTAVPLWPGKTLCKRWKKMEEKSANGPSTSTLAWVPRKPIRANRGLNFANRGIHFVPRLDSVPESMINLNLGIN